MRALPITGIAVGVAVIAIVGGVITHFYVESRAASVLPEPVFPRVPIVLAEPLPEVVPKDVSCDVAFAATLSTADRDLICSRSIRLIETRGIEVDLTAMQAFLIDGGKIVNMQPVLYQAPEGMWYEAPTGYYRIGAKRVTHLSSLFPVTMPWSLQYYEDFFMHGIPYHADGTPVSTTFTGGCIRFTDDVAKVLYEFLKSGDQVAVYQTFADRTLKVGFHAPVELSNAWVRQRFVNPYRSFYRNSGSIDTLRNDYYSHTGVDFALNPGSDADRSLFAVADGTIEFVQRNDGTDHGLGNAVILGFSIAGVRRYALYSHLDTIEARIAVGSAVRAGDVLGVMGNSGNGCRNYWKIGPDGCATDAPNDTHLHFEIKDSPVVGNPKGGEACQRTDGSARACFGYTPDYPQTYGYYDPLTILFDRTPTVMETL